MVCGGDGCGERVLRVCMSACAHIAQVRHAHAGVETGLAREGSPVPIEIMGLMIGHVDPEDASALVVTDAFPLPIEGSETTVVADNPEVNGYMSELTDTLERVRGG